MQNPWTLVGAMRKEATDDQLTGTYLLSFLPTASYQQGVLSATLLYEILLGKATLCRCAGQRPGADGHGKEGARMEQAGWR